MRETERCGQLDEEPGTARSGAGGEGRSQAVARATPHLKALSKGSIS